MHQPAKSTYRR